MRKCDREFQLPLHVCSFPQTHIESPTPALAFRTSGADAEAEHWEKWFLKAMVVAGWLDSWEVVAGWCVRVMGWFRTFSIMGARQPAIAERL